MTLDSALSSPFNYRNHGRGLGGGITFQIGKGIRLCLSSCVRIFMLAYAGLDHAYVALTLRTCVVG